MSLDAITRREVYLMQAFLKGTLYTILTLPVLSGCGKDSNTSQNPQKVNPNPDGNVVDIEANKTTTTNPGYIQNSQGWNTSLEQGAINLVNRLYEIGCTVQGRETNPDYISLFVDEEAAGGWKPPIFTPTHFKGYEVLGRPEVFDSNEARMTVLEKGVTYDHKFEFFLRKSYGELKIADIKFVEVVPHK